MVLWKWIKFAALAGMGLRLRKLGLALNRWNVHLMAVVVAMYGEPPVVDGNKFNLHTHLSIFSLWKSTCKANCFTLVTVTGV